MLLQASDRPAEWLGLPPTGRSLTDSSQAVSAVKRAESSGGRAASNAWTEARCAAGLAVLVESLVYNQTGGRETATRVHSQQVHAGRSRGGNPER